MAATAEQAANIKCGGYILADCVGNPAVILLATGSEVTLAMQAAAAAAEQGYLVRVVSMPCAELFMAQDAAYREVVLPANVRKRVAIEAGHPDFWYKFVGLDGRVIGVDRFGESAPGGVLMKEYGFTVENVVAVANSL